MSDDAPQPEGLADLLAHVTFVVTATLSRVAAEHELSLTQLRLLAILRDRQVRMSDLAAHLGLDKSTLTGLVQRAEKRGLIERRASVEDRRAVEVRLSARGRRLAAQVQRRTAAALAEQTDRLASTDQRRLQALLERLVAGD